MPLAAAMVLSAVPAFASEGTSSAEETVEETSEASSAEESESEGVGDVLANLEGTYEELFPVIADAKYDDLWLGFCAQYGDEENAQLYSDMLKGSTTALIYGAEAVDTYAENPDDTAFDCYFLHGVAQFTVEGNTITGTDADGEEVFSHTYTYVGDAEDGSLQFIRAMTRTLVILLILHLQQIRQIRPIILSFATDIPSTRSILSTMEIMLTGWHQELRQMHLRT